MPAEAHCCQNTSGSKCNYALVVTQAAQNDGPGCLSRHSSGSIFFSPWSDRALDFKASVETQAGRCIHRSPALDDFSIAQLNPLLCWRVDQDGPSLSIFSVAGGHDEVASVETLCKLFWGFILSGPLVTTRPHRKLVEPQHHAAISRHRPQMNPSASNLGRAKPNWCVGRSDNFAREVDQHEAESGPCCVSADRRTGVLDQRPRPCPRPLVVSTDLLQRQGLPNGRQGRPAPGWCGAVPRGIDHGDRAEEFQAHVVPG